MTVAPVVVRPEIDSKIASVRDITGRLARYNGAAPKMPNTTQNNATTMNPSLNLRSFPDCRVGSQINNPEKKVIKKLIKKGAQLFSL
jgi:hypothetical protein